MFTSREWADGHLYRLTSYMQEESNKILRLNYCSPPFRRSLSSEITASRRACSRYQLDHCIVSDGDKAIVWYVAEKHQHWDTHKPANQHFWPIQFSADPIGSSECKPNDDSVSEGSSWKGEKATPRHWLKTRKPRRLTFIMELLSSLHLLAHVHHGLSKVVCEYVEAERLSWRRIEGDHSSISYFRSCSEHINKGYWYNHSLHWTKRWKIPTKF